MAATASSTTEPPPPPDMAATSTSGSDPPPPRPLPTTARRPRRRVREVSSRYLSTPLPAPSHSTRLSSSSSSSSCCSSTPSPRAHHCPPTPFANENNPPPPSSTAASRKRAVANLFDEMPAPTHGPRSPTPFAFAAGISSTATPRIHRSSSASAFASPAVLRRGYYPRLPTPVRTSSDFSDVSWETSSTIIDFSSTIIDFSEGVGIGDPATVPAPCESPIIGLGTYRGRAPCFELRSSLPETAGTGRASNPLCFRSLNSALSNRQGAVGTVAMARPPQPPGLKAIEVKKVGAMVGGKRASGRQEDAHQLRMMDNRYLQYRFLNSQAERAAKAKNAAAEQSLYGLSERIAGLRESVTEKKAELERLKKVERVHSISGAQVHYLEHWSDLEGNHSSCLTRAATALHDASLRLPIIGNIRVDTREITEALNCAMQMLEPLFPCVENVLPKVGEIDDVASKLVKVIRSERLLIEECGNLLYQAHNMQIKEYSLRCQLMQLKQIKAS